jgi:hypothetical protein
MVVRPSVRPPHSTVWGVGVEDGDMIDRFIKERSVSTDFLTWRGKVLGSTGDWRRRGGMYIYRFTVAMAHPSFWVQHHLVLGPQLSTASTAERFTWVSWT